MRTEITVPFAIDTAPIEAKVQKDAEQIVEGIIADMVREGVEKVMPKTGGGYDWGRNTKREPEIDWKSYINDRMARWLDEHEEQIVDEAALLLAQRAGRKKSYREVLAEIKSTREDDE